MVDARPQRGETLVNTQYLRSHGHHVITEPPQLLARTNRHSPTLQAQQGWHNHVNADHGDLQSAAGSGLIRVAAVRDKYIINALTFPLLTRC